MEHKSQKILSAVEIIALSFVALIGHWSTVGHFYQQRILVIESPSIIKQSEDFRVY